MTDEPRAPDGRTASQILESVLAQTETKQIADTLGLDLNDYAELVVHYALHPDESPELEVMDDAQARAAGLPSTAECVSFLEKIASGEIDTTLPTERTHYAGYDSEERSSVTLTGASSVKRAPAPGEAQGAVADTAPHGAALRNQVVAARDLARASQRRPVQQDAPKSSASGKNPPGPATAPLRKPANPAQKRGGKT